MSREKIGRMSAIVVSAVLAVVSAIGLASAQNPDWSIGQVNGSGGSSASLAFDPLDGNPSMAFLEGRNDVKFADWNGSTWVITKLITGFAVDLAYDAQNRPCMSMKTNTSYVKFARRSGTTWTYEMVDRNFTGRVTSLAFNPLNGNPAIAYEVTRSKTRDLKLATFNGVTWSTQVVHAGVNADWLSMAFDSSGRPNVAYSDDVDLDGRIDTLRYAHWNGTAWVREVVDASVSGELLAAYVSLAFDPTTGNPGIAYASNDLPMGPRFAWKDNSGWHVEQIEEIDPATQYILGTSLAFNGGRAYVAIRNIAEEADSLELAWRDAGAWSVEVADTYSIIHISTTALAIAPGGLPALAFTRDDPITQVWQLMYAKRTSVP